MKKRQAALYDPYLDTMGGGERHILSVLKVLEAMGYEISIFWDTDLNKDIQSKLHLEFKNTPIFFHNIFSLETSRLRKMRILSQFDIFIYVTDGSYFYSPAKHNYIFCMVPDKKLYTMDLINKVKTFNSIFIANSRFTQDWLKQWGIRAALLYPYIDEEYVNLDIHKLTKTKTILSVGRFFTQLHAKKQDEIIKSFRTLKERNNAFSEYTLILAGGLKDEDRDYFRSLEDLTEGDSSIVLKPNISFEALKKLYMQAQAYWHFTGYGTDEHINPEKVEHLGITPLEAMASGCITYCFNAGGPKELIIDGENGFLFDNNENLYAKMKVLTDPHTDLRQMRTLAKTMVTSLFSYDIFTDNVKNLFATNR